MRADLNSRAPYWGYYHAGGMSASDASKVGGKGILVVSDYADPLSLAVSQDTDMHVDHGTTVRFYHLDKLRDGPYAVVQMPDGPRVEAIEQHEEPEGLMAMATTNLPGHTGMFVAAMGGGGLYYSADITAPRPEFQLVYDFGPGSGPSYFFVSADDRHLVIPKASMISPGMRDTNGPLYDRDHSSEHDREVIVLDISLLTKGNHKPLCNAPPALLLSNTGKPQPGSGKPTTVGPSPWAPPRLDSLLTERTVSRFWPNNGAPDCPLPVSKVKLDSPENLATMGGPHIVVPDRTQDYIAVSQYFVDLHRFTVAGAWTMFGIEPFDPFRGKGNSLNFVADFLPGSGSVGDNTICMTRFNKLTGAIALDPKFIDFTTNGSTVKPGCISWARKAWPHGATGNASPHSVTFIETP